MPKEPYWFLDSVRAGCYPSAGPGRDSRAVVLVMSLKLQALKNIAANWSGLIANMVIGFLLAPFILHRLGDVAFGLYALAFSFTGYYGLLDFGIRSAIIRYVARFTVTREGDELNRLINTSLATYSLLAVVVLGMTAVGAAKAAALFKVPPGYGPTVEALFLIVGAGVALQLPLFVFGAILEGLQRFVLLNAVQFAGAVLRAVLIVVALTHGGGVLMLAVITMGVGVLSCVPYIFVVATRVPIQFGRKWVQPAALKTIFGYGSATFICGIAEKFRFESDAIVIGIMLSAAAITYFSIASRLTDYSSNLVQYLAQVFTPMSSELDASGDVGRLQAIVLAGNRACALVALPLCTGMILLGRPLIAAWMGSRYVSCFSVLVLLVTVRTLYVSQAASTKVAFGMNRHRAVAWMLIAEGTANVLLSVALARPWGILGVAAGTAIPMLGTTLVFLPIYTSRLVQLRLQRYLREIFLAPIVLCLPLALALVAYRRLVPGLNYAALGGGMLVAAVVYGVAFGWWFFTRDSLGMALRARLAKRSQGAAAR